MLSNYLRDPIGLPPLRRYDQVNSPLHQAILNTEERRSQLFPDKRRIPGRKAKFLIIFSIISGMWGCKKVVEIRLHFKRKDKELRKLQRKAAPFLQSMSDLRYCALKERQDMVIHELFEHKGEEYVKNITTRFNQTDLWAPFQHRYQWAANGTVGNILPYHEQWLGRYLHGYDVYNI